MTSGDQAYRDPTDVVAEAIHDTAGDPTKRSAVLVRLADEGVPIAAIARAFKQSFEYVATLLREAVMYGKILVMPAADWPPGTRGERNPTLPPLRASDVETLLGTFRMLFGLTPAEARLFGLLLTRPHCTKEALHEAMAEDGVPESAIKTVDVVICKVRKKLEGTGVTIDTVWGSGYLISPASKDVVRGKLRDYQA